MKRFSCFLFVCALTLCLACVYAGAETVLWSDGDGEMYNSLGEHFLFEIREDHAVLTGYWAEQGRDQPETVNVPAYLGGVPLTAVGWCAFDNWDPMDLPDGQWQPYDGEKVEKIVIPEGVTALEDGSFCEAHGVKSVSLPSTLTEIAVGMTFEHLEAEIEFPKGNPVFRAENGFLIDSRTESLLYCAPSAWELPLPRVRRIEANALENYSDWQETLEFPDSVEFIGGFSAYDCVGLKEIIVPGSVKEIADYGLFCNSAERIVLNEGLEKIGARAFAETEAEIIVIPSTVTWVGYDESLDEEYLDGEPVPMIFLNPDCVLETAEEYETRHLREETENDAVVQSDETGLRLAELIDDGSGRLFVRVTMMESGQMFLSCWYPAGAALDTAHGGDSILLKMEDGEAAGLSLTFDFDGKTWHLTGAAKEGDWKADVFGGRYIFNDFASPGPALEWTAEGDGLLTEVFFRQILKLGEEYDRQKPDRPVCRQEDQMP